MDCAAMLRMQDTEDVGPIDLRVAKNDNASSSLDDAWHAISQLPLPSPPRAASPLDIDVEYPWPSPPPPPPPPPPCDKLPGSVGAGQKGSPEVQREVRVHQPSCSSPWRRWITTRFTKKHRPIRHCSWFCKMSVDLLQIIKHIDWWSEKQIFWTVRGEGLSSVIISWEKLGWN